MSRKYGNHTASGHKFSQIPSANIQRSTFDRSHGHKTTIQFAGRLYPILLDEVLPGDTFNCRAHIFARQATPFQPLLDNLKLTTFTFFIPMRLLWKNWEKFMGAQDNPGDTTDYTIPQTTMVASEAGRQGGFYDLAGIPPDCGEKVVSALPGRAMALVYNEWFRDQDLQDSKVFTDDDGPDDANDYNSARVRGKYRDYFTQARPFLQKQPEHLNEPLIVSGVYPVTPKTGNPRPHWRIEGSTGNDKWFFGDNTQDNVDIDPGTWAESGPIAWAFPNLEVDFDSGSGGTTNTINELRMAFQMQKLFERDARGGTRYTEIIKSHFGVTSPDSRVQRPEFLGGGSQDISTTAVPVTSDAASGIVGELGAYATSAGSGHSWAKSFTEHGYVLTLMCVDAPLTYQKGVHRMWTRLTKYDFYWPALSNIGEQAIRNDEIHADVVGGKDALVFGYVPRYDEYRHMPSRTSSLMRSAHPTSLDVWHLAQDFEDTLPVLGDTFIRSNPPMDRINAITTEDHFIVDIHFQYRCTRPMPTYSVPGLIDHF